MTHLSFLFFCFFCSPTFSKLPPTFFLFSSSSRRMRKREQRLNSKRSSWPPPPPHRELQRMALLLTTLLTVPSPLMKLKQLRRHPLKDLYDYDKNQKKHVYGTFFINDYFFLKLLSTIKILIYMFKSYLYIKTFFIGYSFFFCKTKTGLKF